MWQSISLIDGDCVRDAVTGIQNDAGGTSRGVEGQHSLDGDVHGGGVEGLEHDLGHLLPVGLGVEGSLGEDLHQAVGELTASQVKTDDGV